MSGPIQCQSDDPNLAGVAGGSSTTTNGVYGWSAGTDGVRGVSLSPEHAGVAGTNDKGGYGVYASSQWNDGVFGICHSGSHAGVTGINDTSGSGVYGRSASGFAGYFAGNVNVDNTLTAIDIVLTGGDCAEEFDVIETAQVEPGTVMVLDQEGALQQSEHAYDKKVAGVISGAGDYKPGIVLDRQQSSVNRMPIALMGKVYCKVDAQYAPIEVGDLLTTSPTTGHAMKVGDPFKAFGSVIGKALRPLSEGQGLIPILIALQ